MAGAHGSCLLNESSALDWSTSRRAEEPMVQTSRHVVVGAGPVGSATAVLLAEQGTRSVVVTRSGSGPAAPGRSTRVAADAADADRLAASPRAAARSTTAPTRRTTGGPTDWPPLAASLLAAAERSGAVLATVSNLYAYGPVDGADDRGDPAGGHRHEGPGPPADVARRARRRTRPAGSGSPRCAARTTSAAARPEPARRADAVPARRRARRCRCSGRPTRRTPAPRRGTWRACSSPWPPTSGPGAGRGTCRRTHPARSARLQPTMPGSAATRSRR